MNKRCFEKLHYCLLLVAFFVSSNFIFGQAVQSNYNTTNWKYNNPSQFGFTINDLDFYDDNNVLAVGLEGGIAKSTDGGSNWTYGAFSYKKYDGNWERGSFQDVHFVSATIAYAVGFNGCMAKSNDGGTTWTFVRTPLYNNTRSINTVWFTSENTGYIGGQWNTSDSIPKVYFTNDGGATWDSLVSPSGTLSRYGYVNNSSVPSSLYTVTGKAKEIFRIKFISPTVGYITGSPNTSLSITIPSVSNTAPCLPTGSLNPFGGIVAAALLWKFSNGTLIDYSVTKERIGISGVPVSSPITCATRYGTPNVASATYKAISIVNDSLLMMVSNTNSAVVRVYTGINDSTMNMATGSMEAGRYEIVNAAASNFNVAIPATYATFASTPSNLATAANGKIYVPTGAGQFWTTVDTGRNWVKEVSLPQGKNYSAFNTPAIDISPSGRFLSAGVAGVVADSTAGSPWKSNYNLPVSGSYGSIDFADCNNGLLTGFGNIAVTNDGGKTWFDRSRLDFSTITINSSTYVPGDPTKAYLVTSAGTIYKSNDMNVVPPASPALDPVYADNTLQLWDVATIGGDSVWVCGYARSGSPVRPTILRSVNGGANWTVYNTFPATSLQQLRFIKFASNMVGYVAGSRDTIWKTSDGGVTWNKLPLPTPGVTPPITYSDMCVVDANTVYLIGTGSPRNVIFKTTDGGSTWQDLSNNILSNYPNLGFSTTGFGGSVLFHDVNNGYIGATIGNTAALFITTDGGATWTVDIGPGNVSAGLAFAPKKVTVPVSFENRKLFGTGLINGQPGPILEYGKSANINVNSAETIVNTNCTNPSSGSITINATGGIAPYSYSIDGTTFQSSNTFTGLTQGAKTITIKDSYCGLLTKTINVGFTDNLVLTANNDTVVCASAPVQMLASTNGTGTTYSWTPSAGLTNPNISNPVATVSANSAFTVTATLNGCVKTKTVNIGIKANPVISAGPDKTIVAGDDVQLQGSANNYVSIAWTPSNTLTNANTFFPTAKPSTTTTYTMTVKNTDNCTSTDNAVVTVIPYCVKVMNAFTPNGDGTNDRWIVTDGSACTNQIKVRVFNRYGQEVYKNENYQNNWDGTYGGKPVPDGTYYYAIEFRLINGRTATVKGDVTILR